MDDTLNFKGLFEETEHQILNEVCNVSSEDQLDESLNKPTLRLLFYFHCFKAMDITTEPKSFSGLRGYIPIMEKIGRMLSENRIWTTEGRGGSEVVRMETIDYRFQPRVTTMGACGNPNELRSHENYSDVISGEITCPIDGCPYQVESERKTCNSALAERPIIIFRSSQNEIWFPTDYLDILSQIFVEKFPLDKWESLLFKFKPALINELPGESLKEFFNFNDNEIDTLFEREVVGEDQPEVYTEDEHIRMICLTHELAEGFDILSYIGTQERNRVERLSGRDSNELPSWLLNLANLRDRLSQIQQIDNIWFKAEDDEVFEVPVIAFEHERSNNLDRVFLRFKALDNVLSSSRRFNDLKPSFIIVANDIQQKTSYQNRISHTGEWSDFFEENKHRFMIFEKAEIESRTNDVLNFIHRFLI